MKQLRNSRKALLVLSTALLAALSLTACASEDTMSCETHVSKKLGIPTSGHFTDESDHGGYVTGTFRQGSTEVQWTCDATQNLDGSKSYVVGVG